jgi:hypothetical protein
MFGCFARTKSAKILDIMSRWGRSVASRAALLISYYLGSSFASFFLISGLSYKTSFKSELRISSFPLYSK